MGNFYGVSSQDLRRIIEMLRPTKTDLLLHRVGGFYDGGYILPKCIKPDVIISPGVSNSSTFEEYYADRGAICYLFDYSVDSPQFCTRISNLQKNSGDYMKMKSTLIAVFG